MMWKILGKLSKMSANKASSLRILERKEANLYFALCDLIAFFCKQNGKEYLITCGPGNIGVNGPRMGYLRDAWLYLKYYVRES